MMTQIVCATLAVPWTVVWSIYCQYSVLDATSVYWGLEVYLVVFIDTPPRSMESIRWMPREDDE